MEVHGVNGEGENLNWLWSCSCSSVCMALSTGIQRVGEQVDFIARCM